MKKTILTVFLLTTLFSVFAASYTNNEFQKLANEYNKKAEVAFDNGEYDLASDLQLEIQRKMNELTEKYTRYKKNLL